MGKKKKYAENGLVIQKALEAKRMTVSNLIARITSSHPGVIKDLFGLYRVVRGESLANPDLSDAVEKHLSIPKGTLERGKVVLRVSPEKKRKKDVPLNAQDKKNLNFLERAYINSSPFARAMIIACVKGALESCGVSMVRLLVHMGLSKKMVKKFPEVVPVRIPWNKNGKPEPKKEEASESAPEQAVNAS